MPVWGRRDSYPAATVTITVLVLVNVVAMLARPLVPPPAPNALALESGEYAQTASRQRIKWHALEPGAFALARRRDVPVILFIGSQWNRTARQFDATVLSDPDVIGRMNREFVCVRVDSVQHPEWAAAFLPLSRAGARITDRVELRVSPGFQVWMLDPEGELVESLIQADSHQEFDSTTFLRLMRVTRDMVQRLPVGEDPPLARQQRDRDVRYLIEEDDRKLDADLAGYADKLAALVNPKYGGFPQNGFQQLEPWSWRYLFAVGERQVAERSLRPALTSPIVDWVDGGFFRICFGVEWRPVSFGKVSVSNADMMAMLAAAYRQTGDAWYRVLAERTFDCLAKDFALPQAFYAYREDDTNEDGRSRRASFGHEALRGLFSGEQRGWVRDNLGLRLSSNPQMTPYVESSARYLTDSRAYEGALDRMRRARAGSEVVFGGLNTLDVGGCLVARMLETARLLGDIDRQAIAVDLVDRLDLFRVGNDDVMHVLRPGAAGQRYLGDYLAYSDACLEHYLASGRLISLEPGLATLRRALAVYTYGGTNRKTPSPVLLNARLDPPEGARSWIPDVNAPQVVDDIAEATLPKAIRLCYAYSCLYAEDPSGVGGELLERARCMTANYAGLMNDLPRSVSGYFLAALAVQRDAYAMAVGSQALELAHAVSMAEPNAFAAAAFGPIRPKLQSAAPGVYVFERGVRSGPFGSAEAAARLRQATLRAPGLASKR